IVETVCCSTELAGFVLFLAKIGRLSRHASCGAAHILAAERPGAFRMRAGAARRTQSGFTLVEIAIVLVIIGLLLGGILQRQEMINQAKIKNVINDFNGITVAISSYQDRYRALPGDDQNATTRWPSPGPNPAKGNGDGVIAGLYNANDTSNGGAPASSAESNL